MTRWLLLDYGQVLSTAPPDHEWTALRRAAGPPGDDAERFHSLYWRHRPGYDRGDVAVDAYWAAVLGTVPSAVQLDDLVRRDVAVWLHPDESTMDAVRRAAGRGWQLALFSNAPVEVAAAIDALPWLEPIGRRFYSCRLRTIKPEPDAYRLVMEGLGAPAGSIVFFDDREPNVDAARALGIRAEVYTDPTQIDGI